MPSPAAAPGHRQNPRTSLITCTTACHCTRRRPPRRSSRRRDLGRGRSAASAGRPHAAARPRTCRPSARRRCGCTHRRRSACHASPSTPATTSRATASRPTPACSSLGHRPGPGRVGGTTRAPPRVLPSRRDPRGNYFELIPFGAGRWICAGKPVAGTAHAMAGPSHEEKPRPRTATDPAAGKLDLWPPGHPRR